LSYKSISTGSIIDFNYFAGGGETAGDNREERKLYLEQIEPLLNKNQKSRRAQILSLWLQAKRDGHEGLTPGQIFDAANKFIFSLFILSALLAGAGTAASFLTYSGTRPVNIAVYFIFFVSAPLLLLLISLMSLLALRFNILSGLFSPPYAVTSNIIRKSALRLAAKVSGEKRLQFEATLGAVAINRQKYSGLYRQTLFKLFQITGLMFSTGVLSATIFKIITADLAFGWQTTIQAAPESIHKIVQAISFPWAWAVQAPLGPPSLPQIEGSRIILKEGIEHLLSTDMASWWPFLCFAVFFYTILPRVILSFAGSYLEIRDKKKWFNTSHSVDRVFTLLTCSQMEFSNNDSSGSHGIVTNEGHQKTINNEPYHGKTIALIPGDIYNKERFSSVIKTEEILIISGDIGEDTGILKKMANVNGTESPGRIILFCEAWMPPIKEILNYLKKISELTGDNSIITVGLLGKPSPEKSSFLNVSDSDFMVWQNTIKTLGNVKLSLIRY